MRRRYTILAVIITCAVLLLGNNLIAAPEDDQTRLPPSAEQPYPSTDDQEPVQGYPLRKRVIGGPTDVEWDLDNSFPKRGSVLELILRCPESEDQ